MEFTEKEVSFAITGDATQLEVTSKDAAAQIAKLKTLSDDFGKSFTKTIQSAISGGNSFKDTLKSIANEFSQLALKAALKPLENSVSSFSLGFLKDLLDIDVGTTGTVTPLAKGGVISSPTYFSSGTSLGVMGEAGAEAVLPLARGKDGTLGVQAAGATTAAAAAPVNVTFNISTPDVQGFRKSQSQIAAMLTRTVNRGRKNL